jgi:signal transduction histidine kinase
MPTSPESGFASALHAELLALGQNAPRRTFRTDEVIFTAGEPGDGFFVIESGRVQITVGIGPQERRTLATIEAGDFFGEMAVLDDAPRSATAIAAADTAVFFLSREEFLHLLERRPRLALDLIREFSARMRALNQKYLEEIVQAERLAVVGRFASTIVHDFKNPLAIISLASELAGGEQSTPLLRAKAQVNIARQVDRMTHMLQELIEFARPTGQRPQLATVNFAHFLTPLAEEVRQEIAPRKVTLTFAGPPPELEVRLQTQRLSRLFYNLVNNAVDAMPDGGAITVRFAVDDGALRTEVQDTGPGIAPEIADRLFQPFATHGKAHGTGLGLSICRKIAEDHGGRIWVRGAPGAGATFCFTLPLEPCRAAHRAAAEV